MRCAGGGPPLERLQEREVVAVDVAQLIAGAEAPLLLARQARDASAPDLPDREGAGRVFEVPALEIRLTPDAAGLEADRVQVEPPRARRRQLDPRRPPVRLDLVPEAGQR